uniref:Uncharacterized protein n=1 Tax=viral metagenome TaxID=1070528 RepID=A0A6C0BYU3_9ZZZZ
MCILYKLKKPNVQFHVYGMTPGWGYGGKRCGNLTVEQCDALMKHKHYRETCHNPSREQELFRRLQRQHTHIKFMWSK